MSRIYHLSYRLHQINCVFCKSEIYECMGYLLARDVVTARLGQNPPRRAICPRCGEKPNLAELVQNLQ